MDIAQRQHNKELLSDTAKKDRLARLASRALENSDSPQHWQSKAACIDEDPELFFPIGNTGPALQQIEEAKIVCRSCPVVDTCLKQALENGDDHGIWGGMSEDERRALRRRQARVRKAK